MFSSLNHAAEDQMQTLLKDANTLMIHLLHLCGLQLKQL